MNTINMVIIYLVKKLFLFFALLEQFGGYLFCFDNFMADESISSGNYRKYFESLEFIYPALTLCFREPFYADKLIKYKRDKAEYFKMLSGKHISRFQKEGPSVNEISNLQRLYSIPYEEVSLDLELNRFDITSSFKY